MMRGIAIGAIAMTALYVSFHAGTRFALDNAGKLGCGASEAFVSLASGETYCIPLRYMLTIDPPAPVIDEDLPPL